MPKVALNVKGRTYALSEVQMLVKHPQGDGPPVTVPMQSIVDAVVAAVRAELVPEFKRFKAIERRLAGVEGDENVELWALTGKEAEAVLPDA